MGSKKRIGVAVNPRIWEEFRDRFKNKASHELENYMKWRLENPEAPLPEIFSAEDIRTFNFNDAERWTVNYSDNKLQVSNTEHATYFSSVENSSADSGTSYTASSWKDVEIE